MTQLLVGEDVCSSTVNRKKKLLGIGIGIVVLAIVLGVAIGVPLSKRSTSDLDKAIDILEKNPLIDGYVISNLYEWYFVFVYK